MDEKTQEEDRDFEEPKRPIDPPMENNPHKRKIAWVRELAKIQKDMELQKKHPEEERELGRALVM